MCLGTWTGSIVTELRATTKELCFDCRHGITFFVFPNKALDRP